MSSVFDNPNWKSDIRARSLDQLCVNDWPEAVASGHVTKLREVIYALEALQPSYGTKMPSPQHIQAMADNIRTLAFPDQTNKWKDNNWLKVLENLNNHRLMSSNEPYYCTDTGTINATADVDYLLLLAQWCSSYPGASKVLAQQIQDKGKSGLYAEVVVEVFSKLLKQDHVLVEPLLQQFNPEQLNILLQRVGAKQVRSVEMWGGSGLTQVGHGIRIPILISENNSQTFPEFKDKILSEIFEQLSTSRSQMDNPITMIMAIMEKVSGFQQMAQNMIDEDKKRKLAQFDALLTAHQHIWDDQDKKKIHDFLLQEKIEDKMPSARPWLNQWELGLEVAALKINSPEARKPKM